MTPDGHPKGFLGTGWRYGLYPTDPATTGIGLDEGGRIAEATGEQVVHQSIWLILSTAVGERVGRPGFGCAIHDLLFSPINPATLGRIAHAVHQALDTWEPRIDLLDVRAEPSGEASDKVVIEVFYLIRATNSRFNMVYPFYLSPAESA